MSEKEVIVLCYWNGCIKYGPDGVYYEGATPKKISVKQKTEFSRLVDGFHITTGFDKEKWKLDIIGRCPVVFSPNLFRYVRLPVVDDGSLKTMLDVPSIHPFINSVELYVEVEPTCDDVINPASSLKRQQPREADCCVNTDMTHSVVKVERDNGIDVNADLGNGCSHGGGGEELIDTYLDGVKLTVDNANADKDLNVPGLEVSLNAYLNNGVSSGSSKLWSSSNKRNKTEKPTKELSKSASVKKTVIEKDKTKEPPPSDKEEDMAEVEVDKEKGVQDGEEEKGNDKVDTEGTIHESQSTRAMDTEIETEPKQPLEMWFPKSEYRTSMKFRTRCYVWKAVAKLESTLEPDELEWFHEHPQFCHFFHMPKDKTHKVMGMWMLLLRMAKSHKCKEAWFVVNGVPIRYSMKEHALLSGLHCHKYPPNFKEFGSLKFIEKHFKTEKATYEAVEKKLVSMKHSPDRLKMAVLYFLSSVIRCNQKVGDRASTVDEIFMRAVTDLEWCKTFPWGRLTFHDNMREIFHMHNKLNGVVQEIWSFPSFIVPLELLAFEAVPVLMKRFKEKVIGALSDCPRMCKTKFNKISTNGFKLSEINDALGSTKDIQSILELTIDEASLISRIMDDDVSEGGDYSDVIIDGWKKRLMVENKKIWFEELYKEDVNGRKKYKKAMAERKHIENVDGWKEGKKAVLKEKQKENVAENVGELKEIMEAGFRQLGEEMTKMKTMVNDKLGNFETRLKLVEKYYPTHVSGKRKESDTSPNASSKRKKPTKELSKSASMKKPEGKGKDKTPSDQELRDAVADYLNAVDIDTISFTDIFKGLDKFGIDLTSRKVSIKKMFLDELTILAEASDKDAEE